jgi:two-component sensor histidine kinase
VHHRIKNNLQGVAGLLQQNAARRPEVADVLSEAVGQVQAIAQVYGLQVGAGGPLALGGLLRAIAQSLQRNFGRNIVVELAQELPHVLPEPESIPVALTVNELLTNAIKHGQGGEVRCAMSVVGDDIHIRIASIGVLPAGFDLGQVRGGVSGLGLVRALLPRRSATFTLTQRARRWWRRWNCAHPACACPRPIGHNPRHERAKQGQDPGSRRRPAGAGHGRPWPGPGRLRGDRCRQRRRRDPAGARAPAAAGAAGHPHGRQERL